MKPWLQIIILSLPFILEVTIESYREMKLHKEDNHPLTTAIRGVAMCGIGIWFDIIDVAFWWQALILSIAIHFILTSKWCCMASFKK